MQRVLQGSVATLRATKLNGDGEPTAPTPPVVVAVTRSDGTGVPTVATAVVGNDATATIAPSETAELDQLTATWTDENGAGATWRSAHEVVGGFYFSIAEARRSDPILEHEGKYSADDILAVRTEVEQEFEAICGQAFVPRFARFAGIGMGTFILPHVRLRRIRSLTLDGTAYTAEQLASLQHEPYGVLYGIRRGARVAAAYEHGWDAPPADLKRAALARLRQRLNFTRSGIPDRAISWNAGEGGTYRLATPSARRTGHPDIDAVLERYSARTPTVA